MRYLVTVLGPPRTFSRSFTIPENALAAIDELRQRQLTNIMIVDEHGRAVAEETLRRLARRSVKRRHLKAEP